MSIINKISSYRGRF